MSHPNGSPSDVVRAFYAALERGEHGHALESYLTADAETLERPNALRPSGARSSCAQMLEASSAGAGLLARQRYEVSSMLEHSATVIVRLRWTGEIKRAMGPFVAGQVLVAHIAQFIEVKDGRIARIETYDCYEPFSRKEAS